MYTDARRDCTEDDVRKYSSVMESPPTDSPIPRRLWFTHLVLTAVFWVGHGWDFARTFADPSRISVGEFVELQHEGSSLRVVAFLSLGGFATLSLFRYWGERDIKRQGVLGWLLIFFAGWALASLAWSDDPAISIRRLVVIAMLSLGTFAVCQRFALADIVVWVLLSTLCYLHIGLAAELFLGTFQPLSADYRFAGTMHPNSQGTNCAFLFLASLFLLVHAKRWRWLLGLIVCESFILLLLTKSRTSIASTITALLLYWFLTSRLPQKAALLACVLCALSIGLLFSDFTVPSAQNAISLGRSDADDATLSGRIFIWQHSLSYVAERPLEGYGFDAFWTPDRLLDFASQQGWKIPNAHSSYLDLCLELGLIGGGLYVLTLVFGIRQTVVAYGASHDLGYAFLGVVLIYIALHGLTESVVLYGSQETFLLVLIFVRMAFFPRDAVAIDEKGARRGHWQRS
jgi:exopolysaccharide production protein ExoQ